MGLGLIWTDVLASADHATGRISSFGGKVRSAERRRRQSTTQSRVLFHHEEGKIDIEADRALDIGLLGYMLQVKEIRERHHCYPEQDAPQLQV
jgi:hypothetical protein